MPKTYKYEPGHKFPETRLSFIEFSPIKDPKNRWIKVLCECGKESVVRHSSLTSKATKSCGCLGNEARRRTAQNATFKVFDPGYRFPDTRLELIEELPRVKGDIRYIKVKCDCGTIFDIRLGPVVSKKSRSCGCYAREKASEANLKNVYETGYVFPDTRLSYIEKAGKNNNNQRMIKVQCSCGSEPFVLPIYCIVTKNTISCGCYRKETTSKSFIKHGFTTTEETKYLYVLWLHMHRRTTEQESYIRKGIKVHHRWHGEDGLGYFVNHILTTIGHRPTTEHSIDRINNYGHYEPGNLRWATREEQAQNTERTIYLTLKGITKPLIVWSRELDIKPSTIGNRLRKGWSDKKTLITPIAPAYTNDFQGYSPKLMPGV